MSYIVLIIEIVVSIWNVIIFIWFKRNIRGNECYQGNMMSKCNQKVQIIIPCLREQTIIIDTIEYFLSIIPDFLNYSINIITTQKERKEKSEIDVDEIIDDIVQNQNIDLLLKKYNHAFCKEEIKDLLMRCKGRDKEDINIMVNDTYNNQKTTQEVVQSWIDSHPSCNVHVYDYPSADGIMADQLNYFVFLHKEDEDDSYYAFYNADSRPDPNTFFELSCIIANNTSVPIIQQYSYDLLNLAHLSNLMVGMAVYQLNFELKYGLINSSTKLRFLFNHIVGHGMIFKKTIIEELGGFETEFWCEDIYMSALLRAKNINVYPLLTLEEIEAPISLRILIKQSAVWFRTAFDCIKIFKKLVNENQFSLSLLYWTVQRIILNLSWIFAPCLIAYTFIDFIIHVDYIMFLLSSIIYLLMIVCIYGTSLLLLEKLTHKQYDIVKYTLMTALSFFFTNFGPIYSIITLNNKKKYKTER